MPRLPVIPGSTPESSGSSPSAGDIIQFPPRGNPPQPPQSHASTGHSGQPPDRLRRRMFGCFGSLLLTTLPLASWVSDSSSPRTYATDVGEQWPITLSDGSTVLLNTDSVQRLWHTGASLCAELVRNEALFDMKPNRHRRLRVSVRDVEITEAETLFTVRLADDGVRVMVAEGTVFVSAPDIHNMPLYRNQRASLRYGETHPTPHVETLSRAEIDHQLSWRRGELVFDSATLTAAVGEVNRYSRIHIEVITPSEHEKIAGVFSATDPWDFARSVTLLYPNICLEVDDRGLRPVLRFRHLSGRSRMQKDPIGQCHVVAERKI